MNLTVTAFTDTYLPTVNGVTYTIKTWRDRWERRGGEMNVVYPNSEHSPEDNEYPVTSLPFPFYNGYRLGLPRLPTSASDPDIIHSHTPFGVGFGGLRLARKTGTPIVASYHTPAAEYADYLTERRVNRIISSVSRRYENWFFDHVDHIITPSSIARDVLERRGIETPITVVPNGINTERFVQTDPEEFRERFELPDGPLVGYTGRHGYEKRLCDIIDATEGLDVTVVFGGDGPARSDIEAHADTADVDVRFLGFLDREDLSPFYSALDVFAFPSPVETQGIVALEANACGTPVVGVDEGALSETIIDGETGYHFEPCDIDGFRMALLQALEERETLSISCLARRADISVEHSVDRLAAVYEAVLR